MSESGEDPRVYFAAERTMLAWLRTGIAVMAFGFVVARFGLFLRLLRAQGGADVGHGVSPYLGAALVGLGIVATVLLTRVRIALGRQPGRVAIDPAAAGA